MELKTLFAQDGSGNLIASPDVYVYQQGTVTPAVGVQDKNGNPLGCPFSATQSGMVQFQAPNGTYDVRVKKALWDQTITVRLIDVQQQVQDAQVQVQAAVEAAVRSESARDTAIAVGNLLPCFVTGSGALGSDMTVNFVAGWSATGFQWTRDGVAIPGATAQAYTVTAADRGKALNCDVTGMRFHGFSFAIPAAVYRAETIALVGRMTAQPSAVVQDAYDNFYGTAGISGILAKLDALYLWPTFSSQAARLNLCAAHYDLTETGAMYFSPYFGYRTDGATGFLDTGVASNTLSKFTQDDASFGFQIGRVAIEGGQTKAVVGMRSSGNRTVLSPNDGPYPFGFINDTASISQAVAPATTTGLWAVRRTAGPSRSLLHNGASIASDAQASAIRSADAIAFFKNNGGYARTDLEGIGAFVGGSLTDAELTSLQAAMTAFKNAVTPVGVAPGVSTATFTAQSPLPDAQGTTAGKGLVCTGLDRDADGTWWIGNYGRADDQQAATNTPSLVHVSADFTTKLGELDLSYATTAEGPQGVCCDPQAGTVWWAGINQNVARQVNKATGAQISSIALGYFSNALAYDSLLNCLIVGRRSNESFPNTISWHDKTNGKLIRWIAVPNNPDHFWFDASKGDAGQLWMSYGDNNTVGQVDILDIASRQIVKTISLAGSLAIEGIYKSGSTLYVANDLYYHLKGANVNAVRTYALT